MKCIKKGLFLTDIAGQYVHKLFHKYLEYFTESTKDLWMKTWFVAGFKDKYTLYVVIPLINTPD